MDEERDILFKGFAKLVVNKLERNGLILVHPKAAPIIKKEMAKIIAQGAYDLVMHTLTKGDLPEYINDIPDLTEWPEKE